MFKTDQEWMRRFVIRALREANINARGIRSANLYLMARDRKHHFPTYFLQVNGRIVPNLVFDDMGNIIRD